MKKVPQSIPPLENKNVSSVLLMMMELLFNKHSNANGTVTTDLTKPLVTILLENVNNVCKDTF